MVGTEACRALPAQITTAGPQAAALRARTSRLPQARALRHMAAARRRSAAAPGLAAVAAGL